MCYRVILELGSNLGLLHIGIRVELWVSVCYIFEVYLIDNISLKHIQSMLEISSDGNDRLILVFCYNIMQ